MNALLKYLELKAHVRHIILEASTDPNADGSEDFTRAWRKATISIWKLPNLSSLQLGFGPANANCWSYYKAWFEHRAIRSLQFIQLQFMKLVFEALCSRNRPKPCLRSLSIKILPDFHDPPFTASPKFKNILSGLSELHLHMLALSEEDDLRQHMLWLRDFFEYIPRVWLKPSMKSLTHLTLYNDIYWGYWPAVDSRCIRFPKLKHHAMNKYTFAYDWQIEWITAHGPTLETLILGECPILFYMTSGELWDRYKSTSRDDHELLLPQRFQGGQFSDDRHHWIYNRRWHHCFDMLQVGLPFLAKFGRWRDASCSDNRAITFGAPDMTLPSVLQNNCVVHDDRSMRWVKSYLGTPEVFEGTGGSYKLRVKSPPVAEPPYELVSREAARTDEPEASERERNESEDGECGEEKPEADSHHEVKYYDDWTGCQKDDEEAFSSFIGAVTSRASSRTLNAAKQITTLHRKNKIAVIV